MELSRRERQLIGLLAILLAIYVALQIATLLYGAFERVADVVIVFMVAWAVAYLLEPLVERIDRRTRLDRRGAVLLVYAGIAVIVAAVLAVAIPGLIGQFTALAERGPEYGERARALVLEAQGALERAGIRVDLAQVYGTVPQRLAEISGAVASDALGFVSATAALAFNVTLVLIIAFIMLIDGRRLWSRFVQALGPELRSEAELFRQSADRSFGGFIRGSLVVGVFYGIATLVICVALGVPFAGVLAVVSGLAVTIPFFGPIIAMVPVLGVALLGAPDRLLWVLALTVILQQVTLNVIGPRVMSEAIGIHPLFVFGALLLGSRIAGFWGVLLAMPVAGVLATFVRYGYELARGRRARTQAATLIADRAAAAQAGATGARDARPEATRPAPAGSNR